MATPHSQSSILSLITYPFLQIFSFFYLLFQDLLTWIFAPIPPPPASIANGVPKKRVAIIGAGLTGVSSAAHCIGHGFDVQLFESRNKDEGLGGIWSVCIYSIDPSEAELTLTEGKLYLLASST